jgi:hypothetical protein
MDEKKRADADPLKIKGLRNGSLTRRSMKMQHQQHHITEWFP